MGFFKPKSNFCTFAASIIAMCCILKAAPPSCMASQLEDAGGLKTIVLDPGHGGEDVGAKGQAGTLEKDLTLQLAQLTANHLKNQYRVLLTRSSDQGRSLADRTALANHNKADLFISIHCGAAFRHNINLSTIFYYAPPKGEPVGLDPKVDELSNNQAQMVVPWGKIQLVHIPASQRIAETLRHELTGKMSGFVTPLVDSAPLYVLSGADMPAILYESFCLTHPDSEKRFLNQENLEKLANDMAAAISKVFETQESQSDKK